MKIIVKLINIFQKVWLWFLSLFLSKNKLISQTLYTYLPISSDKLLPGEKILSWTEEYNSRQHVLPNAEVELYFEEYRKAVYPKRPSRLKAKFLYPTLLESKRSADRGKAVCKSNLLYPTHSFYQVKADGIFFKTDYKFFLDAINSIRLYHKNRINKSELEKDLNRYADLYWRGESNFVAYPEIIMQGKVTVISEMQIEPELPKAKKSTRTGHSSFTRKKKRVYYKY